jgi:hypothetical protein
VVIFISFNNVGCGILRQWINASNDLCICLEYALIILPSALSGFVWHLASNDKSSQRSPFRDRCFELVCRV